MSTETSAITWTWTRRQKSEKSAWQALIGPVLIRIWITARNEEFSGQWIVHISPMTTTAVPLSIAPDDLPGAQAAALKLAEEILKPYADAYSVIAEERMR